MLVERKVWCVEEVDLTDLRVERIHPERGHRRALLLLGDGQLQFHAVGVLDEIQDLAQLLFGEVDGGACGHRGTSGALERRIACKTSQ